MIKTYGVPFQKSQDVWIGIDQSYTGYGLTVLSKDGGYATQVMQSPLKGVNRLLDIQWWVQDVIQDLLSKGFTVKDVAIEAAVRQSHSALISGELLAVTKIAIWNTLGIQPIQIPPMTLKKYVTGKGTGVQKNQMLLKVYQKWNVEFDDDNAADSYGLARIVAGIADTAYEKEVVTKMHDPKYRS